MMVWFRFALIFAGFGIMCFAQSKANSDKTPLSGINLLDELGTLEGFKIKLGKFNKDKDLVIMQSTDFQVLYSQEPIQFNWINDKKEKDPKPDILPIYVKREGIFQGNVNICSCKVEVPVKDKDKQSGIVTRSDCSEVTAEIVCDESFPIAVFSDRRDTLFVLQLESVSDKKAQIKYKDQVYHADLSSFQHGSIRESTTRFVAKHQEKIKQLVGDNDFKRYRKDFSKCLEDLDNDCVSDFIENSSFLVEKGFDECSFQSDAKSEDYFQNCLKSNKSNLKQVLLDCLKKEEFPDLMQSNVNDNVVEAVTNPADPSSFCVFSKGESRWRLVSIGEY